MELLPLTEKVDSLPEKSSCFFTPSNSFKLLWRFRRFNGDPNAAIFGCERQRRKGVGYAVRCSYSCAIKSQIRAICLSILWFFKVKEVHKVKIPLLIQTRQGGNDWLPRANSKQGWHPKHTVRLVSSLFEASNPSFFRKNGWEPRAPGPQQASRVSWESSRHGGVNRLHLPCYPINWCAEDDLRVAVENNKADVDVQKRWKTFFDAASALQVIQEQNRIW